MRIALAAAVALMMACTASAEEHRHLGPHQHGHGTFTIAVDGAKVLLELDTPGHDVLGFERAATTDADKEKLSGVEKAFSDPLKLFVIPDAAGCKVASAKAGPEEEHEAAEAHDDHDGGHGEHHHSDFNASYELECAKPEAITGITFKYFDVFAGAQELTVNIATPKGQTQQVVTRAKPQLSLEGLM
jgi:hypothetical protein